MGDYFREHIVKALMKVNISFSRKSGKVVECWENIKNKKTKKNKDTIKERSCMIRKLMTRVTPLGLRVKWMEELDMWKRSVMYDLINNKVLLVKQKSIIKGRENEGEDDIIEMAWLE